MPTMPAVVYLTRHAESADPTVFHGAESDVCLSPRGAAQADAAAEYFATLGLTAVWSSGMLRARLTAAPTAARLSLVAQVESGLHERAIGPMSGQSLSATEGPWAETVRRWSAGETDFTTPGAESYAEARDRALAAFGRVCDANPGGRVLVVAHGITVKILLLTLLEGEGYGPTGWERLGRVANLSTTGLVPAAVVGWRAESLLRLPPGVAEVSGGVATGLVPRPGAATSAEARTST